MDYRSESLRRRLIFGDKVRRLSSCLEGRYEYVYSIVVKHIVIDFKTSNIIFIARQFGGDKDQTFHLEGGNRSTMIKKMLYDSKHHNTPIRITCTRISLNHFGITKIQNGTKNEWIYT